MASVKLRLRTYGDLGPLGYPIVFYILYQGKPYTRRTGFFSHPKDWNDKTMMVRSSHPQSGILRVHLGELMVTRQIELSHREQLGLSFSKAWARMINPVESFTGHWEKLMEIMLKGGNLGNLQVYQRELAYLRNWMGADEISFSEISHMNLKRLVAEADQQGLSYNSISHRIRTIKAVWNSAKKEYPELNLGDPFQGLLRGRSTGRTSKRKISHQDLQSLRKLLQYTPANEAQQRAIDVFMLAIYLRGAGIIDLLYLQEQQLKDGYMEYRRLKMPKKQIYLKVKAEPEIMDIWNRYAGAGQPYLFNLVRVPRNDARVLHDNGTPVGTMQYNIARKNVDVVLKRIGKKLGLDPNLSMIQARHSWVVLARDAGLTKEVIQQCIGHQENSVLDRHYFGQFDQKVLDEANRLVLDQLI